MDLVDLDKVLDDFEMNEDKTDLSKNLVRRENRIESNHFDCNLPDEDSSISNKYVHHNQEKIEISAGSSSEFFENKADLLATSNNNRKKVSLKHNVNVANVFSSLVEYINAGSNGVNSLNNGENDFAAKVDSNSHAALQVKESALDLEKASYSDVIEIKPEIQTDLESENSLINSIKEEDDIECNEESSKAEVQLNKNIEIMKSSTSSSVEINSTNVDNNTDTVHTNVDEEELEEVMSDKDEISNQCSESLNVDSQEIESKEEVRVIGFESTMDDVSDGELESYLQELELETKSLEKTLDLSGDCSMSEQKDSSLKNQISNGSSNNEEELIITDTAQDAPTFFKEDRSDNLVNIDSISQASTIEINDVQSLRDTELDDIKDNDSVGSNITIDLNEQNENLCSNDHHEEIESNEVPMIDDKTSDLNSVKGKFIPNRPNHLDLPSICEVQLGAPGQTPINTNRTDLVEINSSGSSSIESGGDPIDPTDHDVASPDFTYTSTSTSTDDYCAVNNVHDQEITTSRLECENNVEQSPSQEFDANASDSESNYSVNKLGKQPPYWIPDHLSNLCMQCAAKFTVIKRRHHCRACGQVLCSKCCSMKARLSYLGFVEARVCVQCYDMLARDAEEVQDTLGAVGGSMESEPPRQPNPNNPMEYCSVIPPLQQVSATPLSPISVMVPVGVLKREGLHRTRTEKNVMFSDGIRPGCDLTELDSSWETRPFRKQVKRLLTPIGNTNQSQKKSNQKLPLIDEVTGSYVPNQENLLPPMVKMNNKTEIKFIDVTNNEQLIKQLHTETLTFAVQRNFYISVNIINLEECCVNKVVFNFCTQGLHSVGQDEIVILLELADDLCVPKDIFIHLNNIYVEASKGHTISEMGFSLHNAPNLFNSKEHGGFLYIRPTFQCLQGLTLPSPPYLIGVLIHRWEVPWAKIFPLRLMLRLGALFRYYPSPIVSVRHRESVYAEIAHTIINLLADFRNYSYSLANVRGMVIHMEERKTTILIPRNRYDQMVKALNNSSDHILALGGNFSRKADGHLVCIQNTETGCTEANSYSTQAINIQGKPRNVTGASFLVLNESLKSSSGLSGKCSIVEDGLMVQVLGPTMTKVREALRNMKDFEILCGPIGGDAASMETVLLKWTENDLNFNVGVISPIDRMPLNGVPSIRVHGGLDYSSANYLIRWTEVFIINSGEDSSSTRDPIDISKLAEQVGRSTCMALVTFLDLLAASGFRKLALRTTLNTDNVSYEAGSMYTKLAPLYMNALDNELISTLHKATTNRSIETTIVLELIFYILDLN